MSAWIVYSKDGLAKCEARKIEYNGEFMGACSVGLNISSPSPIGFEIGDWVEYRGERFELNYDPSVVKESSSDTYGEGFVYENVVFNSLSDELTRCDFLDVVPNDNQMHYTSLPTFSFYANDITKLAERIQANLDRVYTGNKKWTVSVHPEYINAKDANISANNITCWDALALVKSQFDANFIVRGRKITIGTSGIAVGNLFTYGKGNGLYKIERNAESNQKIITRLRAYGSTKNLPNGYYRNIEGGNVPNNMAVQHLMLPSFPTETLDPYLDSDNINDLGVREGTVFFDGSGDLPEIYPTMEGMTAEDLKSAGIQVNSTGALDVVVSAEQIEDDGVIPEEGEIQGTFTITLKDIGFDINNHLSTTGSATIAMKDGMCGGREFEIVECKKDGSNYILTCNRAEDSGLGLAFPYKDYQIKSGDKFVLLNIEMPDVYIKAASQRLLTASKEYLAKNDYVRYSYTPSVDNIYMARQHDEAKSFGLPSIHDAIKEGDFILFEDDDLHVSGSITIDSLSITEYADESIIPEYEITLKEEKTVGTLDKIQNQISSILSVGTGGGVNIEQIKSILATLGARMFLSKQKDDATPFSLEVGRNLTVGEQILSHDFAMGEFGNGFILKYDKQTGQSYFEVDRMLVRKMAYFVELVIKQLSHVGGQLVLSPASMRCSRVEEYEEFYRCYFESERDGKTINNEFRVNDQARAQSFNIKEGVSHDVSNQYYWRLVVGTGDDYIDLSKIDCDEGSLPPLAGDDIVQLGNRIDPERQNAIILSTIGEDAPSFKQYEGIQYYTFAGKEVTVISPKGNVITGDFLSKSGKELLSYIDDLGARLDTVQYQTDKSYDIWFYPYVPTLDNYPASEWIDDAGRREHVQDIFYNEDSGRAYRFLEPSVGVFEWVEITDHETVKALEKASKAQETADSKIRNFVAQPVPPYDKGDRWSNASYGDLYVNDDLVCIVSRGEGESFAISDWKLSSEVGTKKFTSEIKRLDDEILLRVTSKDVDGKISEAGVQIKSDVAALYATKTTVDSINGRVTTAEAQISVNATNIESKVSKNGVISSINQSSESVTINANKINLNGVVTFSMLSGDMQNTINAKANASSLGSLAYQNSVGKAMLDSTIISGGYINTSLIDVNTLVAKKVVTNGDSFGVITTMADGEILMKTASSVNLLRIYSNGSSSHIGLTDDSSNSILLNPGGSSFSFSNGKYLSLNPTNGIEFSGGMGIKRFAISSIMTSLSADGDLCIIGGNYTMPNASFLKGRVMWVYATREVTLTGSFMNSNGSSASSISCHGMNFFISNGSNWYRGYCQ